MASHRRCAPLSLTILLGLLATPLAAEELGPAELEQLRERIDQTQGELRRLEGDRDQGEVRLRRADRAVSEASRQLAQTESALNEARRELAELRRRQARRHAELDQEHGDLGRQIRALYQDGEQDALRVLLNQDDPRHLGRMLVWSDYVGNARRHRIDAIQEALDDLARLDERISRREVELEHRQSRQAREREALEATRAERRRVLEQIARRVSERSRDLEAMEADEERLERLLGGLQDAAPGKPVDVGGLRGALDWPVRGRIRAAFGSERESGLRWRGVFIAKTAGEAAVAPAPGRVVFADWMRGYGMLLIVDHGSGFLSLYGHSEGLLADIGDWVETGRPVVLTGNSGGYDEPGLYFELRRDGQPVDPVSWLRPR